MYIRMPACHAIVARPHRVGRHGAQRVWKRDRARRWRGREVEVRQRGSLFSKSARLTSPVISPVSLPPPLCFPLPFFPLPRRTVGAEWDSSPESARFGVRQVPYFAPSSSPMWVHASPGPVGILLHGLLVRPRRTPQVCSSNHSGS